MAGGDAIWRGVRGPGTRTMARTEFNHRVYVCNGLTTAPGVIWSGAPSAGGSLPVHSTGHTPTMPTKPDVGIRNVATQRWATSSEQIPQTTAHAVLRCFAASTCWNGGGATGGYTLSTARSVASAKATGRSKPIRSDSVRPATSGYVAPTVRERGMTRTQGPRHPHGLPNALLRPGLAPQ